jgi:hypothetical protein
VHAVYKRSPIRISDFEHSGNFSIVVRRHPASRNATLFSSTRWRHP